MKKAVIPILVAVIAGLSVIWVAEIFSDTAIGIKNKGFVTVKGFAKKEIRSDLGVFRATIVEEHSDLKTCYARLSDQKKRVQEYLVKFGLSENKVHFNSPQILENYKINEKGHRTNELESYRLSERLEIKLGDVDTIARLSEEISTLLNSGVKIFISSPQFVYTKLDDLKIEMIGKATANAKSRLKIISKKGDFDLGPVASVRVGIFQITPAHSTEVSNYGMNDTSSIDKEIKSTVEIKYIVR